jgi:hypothetical protein
MSTLMLNVLCTEDPPHEMENLTTVLKEQYVVIVCPKLTEAKPLLSTRSPIWFTTYVENTI